MALIKDAPIWNLYRNRGILPWSTEEQPFYLINASDTLGDQQSYLFEKFPFTLIHYIVSGEGFFILNGTTFRVRKGDIFYVPADSTVRQESDTSKRWRKKFIVIYGPWFDTVMRLFKLSDIYLFHEVEAADVIFDQVIHQHNQFLPHRDEVSSQLLLQLVWKIKNRGKKKEAYSSLVNHTRIYLEEQLFGRPDLDRLAEIIGTSRSNIQAKFKKETGVAPYEYFLRLKMDKAKELLSIQRYSVEKTAKLLNFYDRFHFSRTFKRYFGISPAACCKSHSADAGKKSS